MTADKGADLIPTLQPRMAGPSPVARDAAGGSTFPRKGDRTPDASSEPRRLTGSAAGILLDPVELSRRVNKAFEAVEPNVSREAGLERITEIISGSGHILTTEWWNNLLDGVPNRVRRPGVLRELAGWLDVDATYFTHTDPERDDRIEAELDLYRTLREIHAQLMRSGITGAPRPQPGSERQ